MTLVYLAAGGVLAATLAHIVAGWLVSNRLHREVFSVGPREKELTVRVREVSAGSIALESTVPRQETGHPGVLGLRWEGGHGRLGELIDVVGARFIREFEPADGLPPVCEGPLTSCPPVEIDPYVYPADPSDVGLGFDEVAYDSRLGPMGAWRVPVPGTSRWAVHCHGWTAERRELIRFLPTFHNAGFTSLVIDYRNDPGLPRDPTGRYRFGITEWEDLEAAVRFALDRAANGIVLTGCSTGAAVVMSFLERSPLANSVEAVVLDAPNIALTEGIRHAARDRKATTLMIEFGMWIADLRWKVDWDATNYVSRAEQILRVPTLVFHGTSDQVIPISVSRRLAARAPDQVALVETPAAGHVMSWNADPDRYTRYLRNFLDRL